MSARGGYDVIIAASGHEAEPSAKAVLCWLAYFADRKTRTCYPSQELLAAFTGRSVRRIGAALKMLEDDHVISRKERRIGNRRTTDLITLSRKLFKKPFQPDTASASKSGFEPDKSASLNRTQCPGNYKEQVPPSASAETAPRKNKILRL